MHVGHYPGVVCCAAATKRLPLENIWGLFLHEFGHVIGGPTEFDADWAIWSKFGIPILYDNGDVQYVQMKR
jgi:bacillopeptidase F (M6 metalloprotease family)